jgi:hypothetical protein
VNVQNARLRWTGQRRAGDGKDPHLAAVDLFGRESQFFERATLLFPFFQRRHVERQGSRIEALPKIGRRREYRGLVGAQRHNTGEHPETRHDAQRFARADREKGDCGSNNFASESANTLVLGDGRAIIRGILEARNLSDHVTPEHF